ncbi:hypothetical protein GCM10011534_12070 [Pseudooceanicola nanhaiensis]|uniref:Uncharacterized protein n=1 Tax=Pseudooceanicola nanhaiensis TaxID=375761 RepID=A0A917WBH1_9RHOB|nr:hypothetical protein [Pseudooceanicola nanhaiensis]GGL91485.1 hypothetical protein GCM10011534_12070 [Pseudooceanicola nanhaiensis]
MSVTGRTLSSVSQSPATGMHSAALVPGLGAAAHFTVFFAFKDPGGNTNNTIWADDNGGCQIFINASTGRVSARYSNTSSGGFYTTYTVGQWVFLAVRMGLDISGGVNDVVLEAYDAVLGYETAEGNSSGGGGPRIETDGRHYALGDDAGTAFTDDGTEVKVFGLALVDGLWTLDQLGCDTTTGQAKAFDPAAEAALVYALRGLTSVGNDDSGNGNHFTVENGGVVFDEADLPPGVSLPSSGVSLTAVGVSAPAEIGATALAQTHALTAAGLVVVAGVGAAELSVRHALTPAGFDASVELGAPTISQGQATVPQGVEVEAEVGSPAIAQRHALSAAGLEGVADLGAVGVAQVHSLAPTGLPIISEIGSATLTQDHIVAATGVEASARVGTPVVTSFSGLLGVGVEIAAFVGAPVIAQRHDLTPAVLGVSAEVGAAVLTQVHSLSAFSIVTASEVGSPVVRDASLPSLVVIEISGAPAAGLSITGRPAPPVVSVGGPNDIAFIIGGL